MVATVTGAGHSDDVARPGINKVAGCAQSNHTSLYLGWHARNDTALTRNNDGAQSCADSGSMHGGYIVHS
jgi:hypothetical protein